MVVLSNPSSSLPPCQPLPLFRVSSDVNCIYVETVQDPEGYTQRYWVSVETGLLVASERLLEGETIYRMASLTADLSTPSTDRFILPDGTVLLDT